MWHLRILVFVYLFSLLSISVAVLFGIDIQLLLRIPGLDLRWIDAAIGLNLIASITALLKYSLGSPGHEPGSDSLLRVFIVTFLIFEGFQLVRTYGVIDVHSQIALFMAMSTVSVLLWFTLNNVDESIHRLILVLSLLGAVVLTINVITLVAGFSTGISHRGLWNRAELSVLGSKETISDTVLVPIVLLHGIASQRLHFDRWKRAIYTIAFGALFVGLVLAVHRGLLTVWALVFFVFLPVSSGASISRQVRALVSIGLVLTLTVYVFGDMLKSLGYDPIDMLARTIGYSTDIEQPGWDKGRSGVQAVAVSIWLNHFWFGVGYDELSSYYILGSTSPHNGLITSLFQRGVIGTFLQLSIFGLCYYKSFSLWRNSRFLSYKERLLNQSLIFAASLWIIPFLTQEIVLEKYVQSIQYLLFGAIVALDRYYRGLSFNPEETAERE